KILSRRQIAGVQTRLRGVWPGSYRLFGILRLLCVDRLADCARKNFPRRYDPLFDYLSSGPNHLSKYFVGHREHLREQSVYGQSFRFSGIESSDGDCLSYPETASFPAPGYRISRGLLSLSGERVMGLAWSRCELGPWHKVA